MGTVVSADAQHGTGRAREPAGVPGADQLPAAVGVRATPPAAAPRGQQGPDRKRDPQAAHAAEPAEHARPLQLGGVADRPPPPPQAPPPPYSSGAPLTARRYNSRPPPPGPPVEDPPAERVAGLFERR